MVYFRHIRGAEQAGSQIEMYGLGAERREAPPRTRAKIKKEFKDETARRMLKQESDGV